MSTINKLQNSRLYTFIAAHKWFILLIWSLWLTLEYFALGPYSYVRIHDWGDSVLPMWVGSADQFREYGFNYWSNEAASGFDRLSAIGPLFRTDTLLFFIFPGWLAVGLAAFVQRFIAGYFTYRLCRDCLKLGELPSLVAGLAYSGCFFYFQSGFAGEAGFPLILWSLERISQRKGPATYLFAALLGVFVLFSSSFALSIPFILVMALAWFVLVRRLYSLRFLSLFATFCIVLIVGEIPWILAAWSQSEISHRTEWIRSQGIILSALKDWHHFVFDAYTIQIMLGGLALSILGLGASRLRIRGILLIGIAIIVLVIARGYFPNTQIWGFLGIAILAVVLLRPFAGVLMMVLLLLAFCMLASALQVGFLRLSSLGSLSSFQFDRFYLLAPFFAVVAGAYGLSLMRRVKIALTDSLHNRMEYSVKAILCVVAVGLLVFLSVDIKSDHYREWGSGARYAMLYENPQIELLKTGTGSEPFRVATISQNLHPAYANAYGLETADGYVALYPLRYKQFWGKVIEPLTSIDKTIYDYFHGWGSRIYLFPPSNGEFNRMGEIPFDKFYNLNLLSLANTKYLISSIPLSSEYLILLSSQAGDEGNGSESLLNRIKRVEPLYVYENTLCMPRFFLCGKAMVLDNSTELLTALGKADLDVLRDNVFIDKESLGDFDIRQLGFTEGTIQVKQYTPDRIILSANLDNPGILVASISYSPYWTCKVNGSEEKIFPAYHAFMGIFLAGNESEVEIEYHPPYRAFW